MVLILCFLRKVIYLYLSFNPMSVSYTHLDVYKRQAETTVVIETMSGKLKMERSAISLEMSAALNKKA